jgi:hypothetical protein
MFLMNYARGLPSTSPPRRGRLTGRRTLHHSGGPGVHGKCLRNNLAIVHNKGVGTQRDVIAYASALALIVPLLAFPLGRVARRHVPPDRSA